MKNLHDLCLSNEALNFLKRLKITTLSKLIDYHGADLFACIASDGEAIKEITDKLSLLTHELAEYMNSTDRLYIDTVLDISDYVWLFLVENEVYRMYQLKGISKEEFKAKKKFDDLELEYIEEIYDKLNNFKGKDEKTK